MRPVPPPSPLASSTRCEKASFPTRRSSDLPQARRPISYGRGATSSPGPRTPPGRTSPGRWSCTAPGTAARPSASRATSRSEEHTSELQSPCNLVCRLLLEKKKVPSPSSHPTRRRCGQSLLPLPLPPRPAVRKPLSLHDALPICRKREGRSRTDEGLHHHRDRERPPDELRPVAGHVPPRVPRRGRAPRARLRDRKSTRLNSSHLVISYAVFCLKKKKCRAQAATRLDADAASPSSLSPCLLDPL